MPPKRGGRGRGRGRGRGGIRDDDQPETREYRAEAPRGRRDHTRGRLDLPTEHPTTAPQQAAWAQPRFMQIPSQDMPEHGAVSGVEGLQASEQRIRGQRNIRDDVQSERRYARTEGPRGRRGGTRREHDVPAQQPTAAMQQAASPQLRFMQSPLQDMPEYGAVSRMEGLQASEKKTKDAFSKQLAPIVYSSSSEGVSALEKVGLKLKSVDISTYAFPPRRSIGTKGRKIGLIANYFEIEIPHGEVYHYDVEVNSIRKEMTGEATGESDSAANIKKYKCLNTRHNRNVIENMLKQVGLFSRIRPAYDGVKNLFTRNPLPIVSPMTFSVKMEENDRTSQYEVTIKPVNKEGQTTPMISLEPLHHLLAGRCNIISEEIIMGVMALETILRHGPALKLVPVGRSFFHKPREDEIPPLSGGREIWMGYHQSVKIAQWKPMINIDMSATTFYKSGPVIDYMLDIFYPNKSEEEKNYQLSRIRYLSDSQRRILAKELKTLRIEVTHLTYPRKYRVHEISKQGADATYFLRETGGERKEQISVSNYFRLEYRALKFPNLPCLDVGSAKKNIYLPLEVCNIVEGQHCKKKLTDTQTSEMIKYTARPPAVRFSNIQKAIQQTKDEFKPFSAEFGIRINTNPTKLEGRVLDPPHVMYDQQKEIMPYNGAWDMKGKRFFTGKNIDKWILISFSSARWCDRAALENFAEMLCRGGEQVGMNFANPVLIQNCGQRVVPGEIIKTIKKKEPALQLAVVVLPKDPSTVYTEIKSVAETELGLMTQCVKDANITGRKCNPQLICNLCQKINAKMGGVNNSLAPAEKPPILKRPVIIIGADCTHPAPGDKVKPSISAVVGSLDGYPSRYIASVRVQEPKEIEQDKATRQEIIVDLKDMVKELLKEFYRNTNGKKPEKIIFYRDGVSEGEFSKVVNNEVRQVRDACKELNRSEEYKPPITFIVVGKRHHTRFAPQDRREGVGKCFNVPPGTTVDTVVTHPVDSDFFMCSHTGIQGTSRPAHYTVLWDDNNLDADELQTLTYFLCHTYVRCTRSISIPCPVMYAHLAAFRAKQYLIYKSEEMSSSGSDSSMPTPHEVLKESVREAVKVVEQMQNTMYFA